MPPSSQLSRLPSRLGSWSIQSHVPLALCLERGPNASTSFATLCHLILENPAQTPHLLGRLPRLASTGHRQPSAGHPSPSSFADFWLRKHFSLGWGSLGAEASPVHVRSPSSSDGDRMNSRSECQLQPSAVAAGLAPAGGLPRSLGGDICKSRVYANCSLTVTTW